MGTSDWTPPDDWTRIETIDAHAGGEPLRIVVGGLPPVEGDTILEKRRYFRDRYDGLRTALLWEPRGHADMYGAIPTEPVTPEADLGVLFMHNDGYSTMCGHGVLALVTAALETGAVEAAGESPTVRLDTPAGPVTASAAVEDGRVASVAFENVPSFAYALDREVEVPTVGTVRYDVAFGGAFYAYCDAAAVGVGLEPSEFGELVELGRAIKRAVADAEEITHPLADDVGFLYGTIFTGPPAGEDADSRNVCVFADGEVDRCPTGTGISGRLALRDARGEADPGEPFVVESIVGSTFTGRIREHTTYGGYDAVVPEIEGSAHVVGRHEFVIDPDDPFAEGFLLR